MQKTTRRTLVISGIVWFAYLVILSLGLLWHFPWRGRDAQNAPAFYDREATRQAIRKMKAAPGYKDSFVAMLTEDKSKSEDQEVDEAIQYFKKTRNTFRRIPCWRPTGVKDELDAEQTIRPAGAGMAAMQIGFSFVAPIRAWDRFRLEFLYGIAGGFAVQTSVLCILGLFRWKHSQQSSNKAVEPTPTR